MKKLFILHINNEFIIFLTEVILNIKSGNLAVPSREILTPFKKVFIDLLSDRSMRPNSIKAKRNMLITTNALRLQSILYKPIIKHFQSLADSLGSPSLMSLWKHFENFNSILKKLFLLHCKPNFIVFITDSIRDTTRVKNLDPLIVKQRKLIKMLLADNTKDTVSVKNKRHQLGTGNGLKLMSHTFGVLSR